ncbi:MAG: hypothetical protein M1399_08765 [Actinobacteria bacterium]|nr:hypothetical protein [Actinomycetota bacterium]MCL5446918.1 hypothetical protein [Actinomycetota bacterium]
MRYQSLVVEVGYIQDRPAVSKSPHEAQALFELGLVKPTVNLVVGGLLLATDRTSVPVEDARERRLVQEETLEGAITQLPRSAGAMSFPPRNRHGLGMHRIDQPERVERQQPIVLGGKGIGSASIDGGAIRGEGGPLHPQLVLPLKIDLDNHPPESMLAICRIKATLGPDQNVFPQNSLCCLIVEDLTARFRVHTIPSELVISIVDLHFWLSSAEVEHIELLRH